MCALDLEVQRRFPGTALWTERLVQLFLAGSPIGPMPFIEEEIIVGKSEGKSQIGV